MIEALNTIGTMTNPATASLSTHHQVNTTAPTGFTEMMTQLATSTINKVEAAEQASIAKMSGAEVPVREMVDKVMAAQQALNTTLAIRDKIVQAYIEISHTQI